MNTTASITPTVINRPLPTSRYAMDSIPASAVNRTQNTIVINAPVSGSIPAIDARRRPPPRNWYAAIVE